MDVLTILPGGIVQGLFTEVIDLTGLGLLSMRRASSIEFEPTSQQWEVRDDSGQVLFRDPSRQACLSWEHQHFNEQLLTSPALSINLSS